MHQKADVDDLLQDICLKLLGMSKSRRDVPGDEARLEAYFRTIAANAALDWVRRCHRSKRSVLRTVSLDDRLHLLEEQLRRGRTMEDKVLMRDVDRLLIGFSDRDRSIFWLYYRQGLTAAEIKAVPAVGLSVKGVEDVIHRMTDYLREKMG